MNRSGHFHAHFGFEDDPDDPEAVQEITINEPDPALFAQELIRYRLKLRRKEDKVVFLCTYGCGHDHTLTEEEKSAINAEIRKIAAENKLVAVVDPNHKKQHAPIND